MPDRPAGPAISYPAELPITARKDELARVIAANQVTIVAGETGSGKTTQLPKICLELGRRSIGHTQPRRLAARTIAERIAEELGTAVGDLVGYQVRFTDRAGPDTRVKLMTDGILLNEIHRDRMLAAYDTIIIDEAHERSLNIDFLLGYLRRLLPERPELRVIVTSATIDPESFSAHFGGAPIVEVSGRTYPVEVRYRPPAEDDAQAVATALDELAREAPGDVLVFLSGENEIRDTADMLAGRVTSGAMSEATEILPLYGRLSQAEQHRVFAPRPSGIRRRIVLATNVAETSLTVPGIRYVVDAGTARISRYSTRSKVQRLPIEPISQASANQRSGRCGRTSDGIAIRLYSQEDFTARPEYTDPEILRTNLAAVILQMIALGLGGTGGDVAASIRDFGFPQPPDPRGVRDGIGLLTELGAIRIDRREGVRLTKVGRGLARLPIDPRFARMVVEARYRGSVREVLAIVAGLTVQDPRERPLERRAQADAAHARFTDAGSDFLTLLNLWNHVEERGRELSSSAFRRLCRAEYLNYLRVREWQDVYRQLARLAKPLGLRPGAPAIDAEGIHRCLLAGLLSHVGIRVRPDRRAASGRRRGAEYLGARARRFVLFPGSALAKKPPAAVMSAELVETSRLFARMNAAIDPAWAEEAAGELVKRSYGEPHWERKQGAAVVHERVTLFGVPIVEHRRVLYSRLDPAAARDLFIRRALVEGDWTVPSGNRLYDFERGNATVREELAELEERTRRRAGSYDDEAVFAFYDRRIPAEVTSTREFERWWRQARRSEPDLLTLSAEALAPDESPVVDEREYPSTWRQGDALLPLGYRFEPGSPDDGVSVRVPLALLPRLTSAGFDWQVPGLRLELVTAMIKALPKALRRSVVPAADWARRLLDQLPPEAPTAADAEPFADTLATAIRREAGIQVRGSDVDPDRIPPHLRIRFRVVDDTGAELDADDDLTALQKRLAPRARESVAKASSSAVRDLEMTGLTSWPGDEIPPTIDTRQGEGIVRGYPALVDEGNSAALRVMATAAEQAHAMPGGVRRLLVQTVPSPVSYVRDHLTDAEKLVLTQGPHRNPAALFDDCLAACVDAELYRAAPDGQIVTRREFEALRDRVSAGLMDALFRAVSLVADVLVARREAQKAIDDATSMPLLAALTDAKEQLAALVYPGFVSATGLDRLPRLPVYLRAVTHRMQRLPADPGRDRTRMTEVQQATRRYVDAGGTFPAPARSDERLTRVRWMLEELRVSLFAQQLGTAEPVSLQRITRVLAS